MADIILGASVIASFLAGMVALFAPCCITVLLPAYMASAFREKKHILKMTFIFFAGISVVLIPIGMGAAWLAQFFRDFHKELYVFGGLFMLALALLAFMGKGMSVPGMKKLKAGIDAKNTKSVFVLGVLSGAATSCCAPVLAGAMTLAVVSGAFWKAIVVTFAYVFGMTFPLFVAAWFYDKFRIEESKLIKGKLLKIKIASKEHYLHSTNLLSGIMFFVIGGIMLGLGLSGNAFWSPEAQSEVGSRLNDWSTGLLVSLGIIPDKVWGIIIIGFFLFLLYRVKKNTNNN